MVNNGCMSVSSPPLLDLKDVAVQALLSSVIMSQKQLQKICGFLWLELFKSSYVIYQLFICECTHLLGQHITKPERFLGCRVLKCCHLKYRERTIQISTEVSPYLHSHIPHIYIYVVIVLQACCGHHSTSRGE